MLSEVITVPVTISVKPNPNLTSDTAETGRKCLTKSTAGINLGRAIDEYRNGFENKGTKSEQRSRSG